MFLFVLPRFLIARSIEAPTVWYKLSDKNTGIGYPLRPAQHARVFTALCTVHAMNTNSTNMDDIGH